MEVTAMTEVQPTAASSFQASTPAAAPEELIQAILQARSRTS
jgi:hypothetical protein